MKGSGNRVRFYMGEDNRYYYLANYKDGKKMYSVSKSDSYIVEDNNVKPKIEVYKSVYNSNIIVNKIYKGFDNKVEYKVIIPKETLTNEFNVDMKK